MPESSQPRDFIFHYEKSKQFRVIHVDGAHGGLSSSGRDIVMSLYSERRPIPKMEVFVFDDESKTYHEDRDKREQKEGIFREVEICAVLNIDVAESLMKWLKRKIDEQKAIKPGDQVRLEH